jgi:hypothetical protein
MRILIVNVTVSVFVLAAAAVIAFGAYPQGGVTVYTGCLTPGGTITSLAASPTTPINPCQENEKLIHLSGGTITKVTAGTGLTGGGSDGYVTVGLDPAFSLPQSCVPGNFPGWSGSLWQCYGAGTGLSADTAGKSLGIASTYQLPQTCTNGQITKSAGPNTTWTCGNQQTYSGTDFALSNQSCGTGQFVTGINSTGQTNCANDHTYSGADFALSNQNCSSGQFTSGVDSAGKLACAAPPTSTTHAFSASAFTGPFEGVALFNFVDTPVVTLNLPAGNYLLSGRAGVGSVDGSVQAGSCSLFLGSSTLSALDRASIAIPSAGNGTVLIPVFATLTLLTPASVSLDCATFKGGASDAVITALSVGGIN